MKGRLQNIILSFKDVIDASAVMLQNAFETMPDACETFCYASPHIKFPTSTQFAAVQSDRGWPLSSRRSIHCCCRFYSATCTDCFSSTSYAEIPVEIAESEIQVAGSRQMAPRGVIELTNTELVCQKICKLIQAF